LKGSHTVKFGAEYRRIGADVTAFSSSAGTYTFSQAFTAPTPTASGGDAFASFLLGYPSTGSIVYATPAQYLIDYYAGYAQDEYRATSKLTLNYGLRYEFETGIREADNHFTVGFDRNADFPVQVPGMALKGGLMYAGQGRSLGLGTGAGGVIDLGDPGSQPGRVHQYSVDYTRELRGGIAASIGYSGSRSNHMPVGGTVDTTVNINQLDPQYLSLGSALL